MRIDAWYTCAQLRYLISHTWYTRAQSRYLVSNTSLGIGGEAIYIYIYISIDHFTYLLVTIVGTDRQIHTPVLRIIAYCINFSRPICPSNGYGATNSHTHRRCRTGIDMQYPKPIDIQ